MDLDKVGKYNITAKIGQGAMGEVYKAHDPILNRFVAIKTMSAAIGADDELRKRFLREAQSAARLNHPNIITLFDFGEDQGKIYMAMELLEGNDLKDLITNQTISQLDDKLTFMEQICDGLAFAHMQDVVHRDLKPANIHVQPNGQIKIMDFGLARLGTSEMTRTGMVMGTPHYMSPEQVKGKRADARSDIFSLGAVFYELLTGRKPFDAESLHAVLFQVMEHQPEDVRHWSPEVPNILVQVVDKALNKDPEQRYAHAGDMREALRLVRQVLAGEMEEDTALATLIQPSPEDATVVGEAPVAGATVLEPPPSRSASNAGRVQGSSALKPASGTKWGKTAVPSKTSPPRMGSGPGVKSGARRGAVSSRPPVPRPMAETPSRMPLYIGGAVAAVAIAIGAFVMLKPPVKPPEPSPSPVVTDPGEHIQTRLELARKSIELKDWKGALDLAERVLKEAPGNAEAARVRDQAKQALTDLDKAADEARAAVQAEQWDQALRAIARVLEMDPKHPVAAELGPKLNKRYKVQADAARTAMRSAATAAERANATADEMAPAVTLSRQAEGLYGKDEFLAAAQKYQDSRNGFMRARDAAEQRQRRITEGFKATPVPPPPPPPSPQPTPTPQPTPHVTPTPTPTTTQPTPAPPVNEEPLVRQVISLYGQALKNKDLALFRSIKPNISNAEEDTLRNSFANKNWTVLGISVDQVLVDGTQATVRASRNDNVGGQPKSVRQTFTLARGAGGWTIRTIVSSAN